MAIVLSVMFIGPQATSLNHIINLFFFSKLAQLLLEHRVKMGGIKGGSTGSNSQLCYCSIGKHMYLCQSEPNDEIYFVSSTLKI